MRYLTPSAENTFFGKNNRAKKQQQQQKKKLRLIKGQKILVLS